MGKQVALEGQFSPEADLANQGLLPDETSRLPLGEFLM